MFSALISVNIWEDARNTMCKLTVPGVSLLPFQCISSATTDREYHQRSTEIETRGVCSTNVSSNSMRIRVQSSPCSHTTPEDRVPDVLKYTSWKNNVRESDMVHNGWFMQTKFRRLNVPHNLWEARNIGLARSAYVLQSKDLFEESACNRECIVQNPTLLETWEVCSTNPYQAFVTSNSMHIQVQSSSCSNTTPEYSWNARAILSGRKVTEQHVQIVNKFQSGSTAGKCTSNWDYQMNRIEI